MRTQVTEPEPVSLHDLAFDAGDGTTKDGSVVDKGVEFSILTAGIGRSRQFCKERCVKLPPTEGGIDLLRIDADQDGAEASRDEITGQLPCILQP